MSARLKNELEILVKPHALRVECYTQDSVFYVRRVGVYIEVNQKESDSSIELLARKIDSIVLSFYDADSLCGRISIRDKSQIYFVKDWWVGNRCVE